MTRDRRWWMRHIAVGVLIGLIISTGLVWRWERGYAASGVTVLGSGDGLSVLIEIDATRVLILSGDDSGEFTNALAAARPGQRPRIDVIVIAPGSERLAERAITITRPERVLALTGFGNTTASAGEPVSSPGTIVLKDHARIELDPGNRVSGRGPGWAIRVQTGTADLLIAEHSPRIAPAGIDAVIIAGSDLGPDIPLAIPRLVSATLPVQDSTELKRIAPGSIERIDLP